MIISYPAIFRKSKENDGWWDVSFPDIWGGVTCGNSFDNAIEMAKDFLKCIRKLSPEQLVKASSLEYTKTNYPNEIVMQIEIEGD